MAANRPDPRLDRFGNNSKLLHRQYKGHENLDQPTKHEKALTTPVFIRMWELAETPKEKHLARLVTIGAFYHAMRSCEYLKVQGERRTKVLCLHNLRFFRGLRELSHDDPDLPFADAICITFNYQKSAVGRLLLVFVDRSLGPWLKGWLGTEG
jgi:hypothetical protein